MTPPSPLARFPSRGGGGRPPGSTPRPLPFLKMSGAGNDFVLLDAADLGARRLSGGALARRLCDRRRSIGADGLLLVRRRGDPRPRPSPRRSHGSQVEAGTVALRARASLEYYNADGSAAFCANGSRCAAWFIHAEGWAGRRFAFDSSEGPLEARIVGRERVRLRMPEVRDIRRGLSLRAAGRRWTVQYLNTGVPHAVVAVAGLGDFDVVGVGRALRRHPAFAPAGANADFLELPRPGARAPVVRLRTYERGVEDETLACGTGATAAAVCAHLLRGLPSPVSLETRGGDRLTVRFRAEGGRFSDVWLEGPARVTFSGTVTL